MATIVVLGMHRSGTSCVARALHEGGMYLGENLMNHVASDNLEGHWEARGAVNINDEILAASGAAWHQVPQDLTLVPPAGIEERMAVFLKQLASRPIHGFKDPRTLITLPLWKPHLAQAKIVACLRHPYNVATSLSRRVIDWKWEQGLELWARYNSRLLSFTSEADPGSVYWFDFDAEPAAAEETLRGLVSALGLQAKDEQFNSFLRHHEEQPPIEDSNLAELYEALRQRAGAQPARVESGTSPAQAEPRANGEFQRLRSVNLRHDELLQRQQASIWTLESELREARSRYDELRGRWGALAEQQQQAEARQQQTAVRCDEAQRRGDVLEAALHAQAQARSAEQQSFEARLIEAARALTYLRELSEQQHAFHVTFCQQLQERIETLQQGTSQLLERSALLGQRVESFEKQAEQFEQRTLLLEQRAELFAQRTVRLEQRLFWPMVARKSRAAWARLKRALSLPGVSADRVAGSH